MRTAIGAPLTRRQREVLDFIAAHITEKGFAPSLAEIGERFQLSSLATVHKHVTNLATKGYVRRRWNCSRAIEITYQDGMCPTCRRPLHVEPLETAMATELA